MVDDNQQFEGTLDDPKRSTLTHGAHHGAQQIPDPKRHVYMTKYMYICIRANLLTPSSPNHQEGVYQLLIHDSVLNRYTVTHMEDHDCVLSILETPPSVASAPCALPPASSGRLLRSNFIATSICF
jgi:hypothetical protein